MFIEHQKTKAKNSLVFGVGVNNATYNVRLMTVEGKQQLCPYYSTWKDMLRRCYSVKYQSKQPTYSGCTVKDEWKVFSTFKNWMQQQNWQGNALDKDLLNPRNTIYGPEFCVFIPQSLNNLLTLRNNHRGAWPLGVWQSQRKNKTVFIANCSFYGKRKHLGVFNTPEEASKSYRTAKLAYISELAQKEQDLRVRQALLNLY